MSENNSSILSSYLDLKSSFARAALLEKDLLTL